MNESLEDNELLIGWKDFEDYLKINRFTLYDWHRYHLRIPFFKAHKSKGSAITITKSAIKDWYKSLKKIKPNLGQKSVPVNWKKKP